MKATCGITECAQSAWTGIQNDSVLHRVGRGEAVSPWSVTGQGFWTSAGDKEADETREEIEEGWSIV